MGDTLTCDTGHKVKGALHAANYLAHIGRGADARRGLLAYPQIESQCIYEDPLVGSEDLDPVRDDVTRSYIDPARTARNVVKVNDGAGGFRSAHSTKDLLDYFNERISTVKKRPRKDAVLMRGLVLQLDPQYIDRVAPNWRGTGDLGEAGPLHDDMVGWACSYFPQENLVGYCIDLDETSVHIQVAFVPVTDDGRLSQKDFFTNPEQLRSMHQEFRSHMDLASQRRGASFEVEYAVKANSRDRKPDMEYKKDRERDRRERALDARDADLVDLRNGITARADELSDWRDDLRDWQQEAGGLHREAREKAEALQLLEADLDRRTGLIESRVAELDQRASILETREADLPRIHRRAVDTGLKQGWQAASRDAHKAAATWLEKYKDLWRGNLQHQQAVLFAEFLDEKDAKGRSFRPVFERFVDRRLKQLETELDVVGDLNLEPGDLEQFIEDGGEALMAQVIELQRDRQKGD